MAIDTYTGLPDDEEDELRAPHVAAPGISASGIPSTAVRGLPAPGVSPATAARTAEDEATLNHYLTSGSGISQVHNPVARGALRGLNVAGEVASAFLPELHPVLGAIPGTEEHHQQLVKRQEGLLGTDLGAEQKEAQTANLSAQPELKEKANELKEEQLKETQEKNQSQLEKQYRQLGLKKDAAGNFVPIPYEEMTPTEQAAHDLKINQAEAADARAQLDRLKTDPNSDLYKMQQQRLQMALQNSANAARRLGLSEAQFNNKVNEQELMKPSGQAQSRGSAAEAALTVLPDLEQQIRANGKNLGPIMGRIQRGEIALGDVDPKIAQLYSTMQSFYSMQPAIHGFRNAEFVKDFNSFVGGLERDPEATIAGLEGLKPTMESIAKEGRTFHKRIVEGQEENKGGEAQGPTATGPNGEKIEVRGGRWVDAKTGAPVQ